MRKILGNIRARLKTAWTLHPYCNNPISAFHFAWHLHTNPTNLELLGKFHLGEMLFVARPNDWVALEEVVLEGEYSLLELIFNGASPKLVVDIGANIGMFSMYVLSRWPSVKVFSVEASQQTYEVLERNRLLNPRHRWETIRYALWKENGKISFENRTYSTSSRIDSDVTNGKLVPSIDLPSLLLTHVGAYVDVMKIDIEGAEEAVLCGNEDLLRTHVENLIVEVHPTLCNHDRVVETLREAYDFLSYVPGRRSSKPLLVASRRSYGLPEYCA